MRNHSKIFPCNVHGSIEVSDMALKIIDTPEFQRLRKIKQLGLCHYVHPTATHSRFEHSLGVYHLTAKMINKIYQEHPSKLYYVPELSTDKINLNSKIIECIKIAGLCHDLGHGPFSHVFDSKLLKNSNSENKKHEIRSCLILEMLCKRELRDELDDGYIEFMKNIINPNSHHKGLLYQIVSNNLNGIDVDKFDYLARDSKNLGLNLNFDHNKLINEFIIDGEDNIFYPKDCDDDIYNLFHDRYTLNTKAYNHKTVKSIEYMLSDIFEKIDPIFKISESINNIENFCKLNDESIFLQINYILNPPGFMKIKLNDEELSNIIEANEIYQNLLKRKLYKIIMKISDENGKIILEKYPNYEREIHL